MLVTPEDLAVRRTDLERSSELRVLARRLRAFVEPLLEQSIYLPTEKAELSRDGGRCPKDGTRLTFDPSSPHRHRCAACGGVYQGEQHDRTWIWPYQLWLSERAIHLALLGRLLDEEPLVGRAGEILEEYARRYHDFPNQDNVLGPTRLFFSTYLESIWLVQVTIAASLVSAHTNGPVRRMIEESVALVASFDEGLSNRQVWNSTAIVTAGHWLADAELVARGLDGPSGLTVLLARGVTGDGLWWEGENYHFFALRGFLLAAEVLRAAGVDWYGGEARRTLAAMFDAPLETLLPDLTLPSRGNAPYGVSIRQPRFAELWELGWARTGSRRSESLLATLYDTADSDAPPGDDPGFAEIAEQEINRPPGPVARAMLGWKALLWMRPEPPAAPRGAWQGGARLLPTAGVAVLRPSAGHYVSIECGRRTGGHGHPDLLHVTVFWDGPFLMDPGTGSYVSPQLHWYRSTLAHNAPGLAGVGQQSRWGWCAAFDQIETWGWCRAVAAELLGPHTRVQRTVVVGPAFVLDVLEVACPREVVVDLGIHPLPRMDVPDRPARAAELRSAPGSGHEHGYDALAHVAVLEPNGDVVLGADGRVVRLVPRVGETLFMAEAPGPSDPRFREGDVVPFVVRRASGPGVWIQTYARAGVVSRVTQAAAIEVEAADGGVDRVTLEPDACVVTDSGGREWRLGGTMEPPHRASAGASPPPPLVVPCPRLDAMPRVESWRQQVPATAIQTLGATHYRRAERAYQDAIPFAAAVAIFTVDDRVGFAADVTKPSLCFRAPDAPDPHLDNEIPDIHSDGIQCYLGVDGWQGYVVIPVVGSSAVRALSVRGTAGDAARVHGTWCQTPTGYALVVTVRTSGAPVTGTRFRVNLIVNEMYGHRSRRAGQLALAGGGGYVYLRGDRESPWTAAVAEVS